MRIYERTTKHCPEIFLYEEVFVQFLGSLIPLRLFKNFVVED